MKTTFALFGNSIIVHSKNQEKSGEKQEKFELVAHQRVYNAIINGILREMHEM